MADLPPESDVDDDTDSDPDDESLIDDMRGSGVGVEDPNIVGDADPGLVDEQVQKDEAPEV